MDNLDIDIKNLKESYTIDIDSVINIKGVLKSNDVIKNKIYIIHNKRDLKSRINIRVVVFDNALLDLEVVLKINKGAENCDTYLKIDCLDVGDKSKARVVPSLEILENEVRGGHGATIGYLDDNQLNYLYSKGINKVKSEKLLVEAFLK